MQLSAAPVWLLPVQCMYGWIKEDGKHASAFYGALISSLMRLHIGRDAAAVTQEEAI